jgi:hypothetical protein
MPFVFLALALAIAVLYIRPELTGTVENLRAQIGIDDQALAAAGRYDAREADLASQRNAIPADELDRLQAYVPDSVDTVRVVIDLNALAARTGVSLSDFAVANASSAASGSLTNSALTDSVDLSLTVTGTYGSFRTFLQGLETSLRPYDVVDIGVKSSATGVYTYALTLRTYSLQ